MELPPLFHTFSRHDAYLIMGTALPLLLLEFDICRINDNKFIFLQLVIGRIQLITLPFQVLEYFCTEGRCRCLLSRKLLRRLHKQGAVIA
jgi:hypothetical protein